MQVQVDSDGFPDCTCSRSPLKESGLGRTSLRKTLFDNDLRSLYSYVLTLSEIDHSNIGRVISLI